uniref:hypothetical protein n=1 Tax=Ornithobacterium rhinotracheale TaxID=28251 RepID=UPI0039A51313
MSNLFYNALRVEKLKKEKKDDYLLGQVMAYYDVITTLVNQANAFDIDIKDLNLDKVDEQDILSIGVEKQIDNTPLCI